MRNRKYPIQHALWILVGVCFVPAIVWAQPPTDREIVSISSAVVSVPSGIIMIAIIIRNYLRLKQESTPSIKMHKYAKKARIFTIVLTIIPLLTVFSHPLRVGSFSLLWTAFLLSIPTLLLGAASYKLCLDLEQKHKV